MVEVKNIEENNSAIFAVRVVPHVNVYRHQTILALSTDGAVLGVEIKLGKLCRHSP